jgi:hypothetical protein
MVDAGWGRSATCVFNMRQQCHTRSPEGRQVYAGGRYYARRPATGANTPPHKRTQNYRVVVEPGLAEPVSQQLE